MVECELYIAHGAAQSSQGFNRYMVECEFVYIKLDCIDICVLIDTWWNVNFLLTRLWREPVRVLIDTWWNVNSRFPPIRFVTAPVLIDTWWNVNAKISINARFAFSF